MWSELSATNGRKNNDEKIDQGGMSDQGGHMMPLISMEKGSVSALMQRSVVVGADSMKYPDTHSALNPS